MSEWQISRYAFLYLLHVRSESLSFAPTSLRFAQECSRFAQTSARLAQECPGFAQGLTSAP
jgi:hypothetical protein